jgi:hypothetical protein
LVKDINPGGFDCSTTGCILHSASPTQLTPVNHTLFFIADDSTSGRELWKSDGTPAGTRWSKTFGQARQARALLHANGYRGPLPSGRDWPVRWACGPATQVDPSLPYDPLPAA